MSVDEYYYGDPFLFECYYDAYEFKRKQTEYDKWDIGAYFKCALNSTILASTPLLDKQSLEKVKRSIPDFPNRPGTEPIKENVLGGEKMSEEEIQQLKLNIERIKNGTRNR